MESSSTLATSSSSAPYLKRLRQREQFDLLRAAAWAEWAGWTCKEWRRSLLPDVQRQVDSFFVSDGAFLG